MSWLAVVVVMVGACGGPQRPERLEDPEPIDPPVEPPRPPEPTPPPISVAPPPLAIDWTALDPDPMHEIRWPLGLSDHPELEPQFEVARHFADPGVDWISLCQIGAHRRTIPRLADQLAYLRAWCAVGAQDTSNAIGHLAALRTSVVPGMLAAVRADIANIVANHGDHDSARLILKKHGLSNEVDVLDRIAAAYVEVGKLDAATDINELAITNDPQVSAAKTCQRIARRMLLHPDRFRESMLVRMQTKSALFELKLLADPTCYELDAQLSCWLSKDSCDAWYKLKGVSANQAQLAVAYQLWPTSDASADPMNWLSVGWIAIRAMPEPDAYHYGIVALEAATRTTRCTNQGLLRQIRSAAVMLRDDPHRPAALLERYRALVDKQDALCWRPPS